MRAKKWTSASEVLLVCALFGWTSILDEALLLALRKDVFFVSVDRWRTTRPTIMLDEEPSKLSKDTVRRKSVNILQQYAWNVHNAAVQDHRRHGKLREFFNKSHDDLHDHQP